MAGCNGSNGPAVFLTHFCLVPQWWVKGALCLLPISDTSSYFLISFSLCFCIMSGFLGWGFFLQTPSTPESNSHFRHMQGDRGDINTSHSSCFNPPNERPASVSARVKLCSCTFIDGWQRRAPPRTRLLHQPDLSFTNVSLSGVAPNSFILNTLTGARAWQRWLLPVVTETPRTDGRMSLASAAL